MFSLILEKTLRNVKLYNTWINHFPESHEAKVVKYQKQPTETRRKMFLNYKFSEAGHKLNIKLNHG